MLGEFVHKSRIYCIKSILDPVTPDETEIKFKSMQDAKHFFAYVASDPFSREELLEVVQWLRPKSCRPRINCSKPTEDELLDMLCLMVYEDGLRGDFRLVELKAPKSTLKLEKCCIKAKDAIGVILKNANILDKALLGGKLLTIFTSNSRGANIVSATSTAVAIIGVDIGNINSKEWEILAEAIIAVPKASRREAFKIAEEEGIRHEFDNKRELANFWKNTCNVFA